jgi:hypothetical protein
MESCRRDLSYEAERCDDLHQVLGSANSALMDRLFLCYRMPQRSFYLPYMHKYLIRDWNSCTSFAALPTVCSFVKDEVIFINWIIIIIYFDNSWFLFTYKLRGKKKGEKRESQVGRGGTIFFVPTRPISPFFPGIWPEIKALLKKLPVTLWPL